MLCRQIVTASEHCQTLLTRLRQDVRGEREAVGRRGQVHQGLDLQDGGSGQDVD